MLNKYTLYIIAYDSDVWYAFYFKYVFYGYVDPKETASVQSPNASRF